MELRAANPALAAQLGLAAYQLVPTAEARSSLLDTFAQVAEWAGHSVAVLLRVYAKCIAGQGQAAREQIGRALGLG